MDHNYKNKLMDDKKSPRMNSSNCSTSQGRPTAHGLGIVTEKPKFLHYAVLRTRFESFSELDWPEFSPVSVKDLVEAGLVYTGVGDSVRCFYCGGGIRNWEEGDRPIVEHARWYPNCPYVTLLKGRRFGQRIANGEDPFATDETMERGHIEDTNARPTVDELIKSPAAQALIQNDFSEADVKNSIQEWQRRSGYASFSSTDLFSILSDMKENSDKARDASTSDTTSVKKESYVSCHGTEELCSENVDVYNNDSLEDLERENERLKELQLCKVCLENTADIIFLPCGHISCCAFCAPALEKCHICRKDINGQVKAIYASGQICHEGG